MEEKEREKEKKKRKKKKIREKLKLDTLYMRWCGKDFSKKEDIAVIF